MLLFSDFSSDQNILNYHPLLRGEAINLAIMKCIHKAILVFQCR